MSLFRDATHGERCPFCGEAFDRRDLGRVLAHYQHQIDAGAPAAIELDAGDEVEKLADGSWIVTHRDGSIELYQG